MSAISGVGARAAPLGAEALQIDPEVVVFDQACPTLGGTKTVSIVNESGGAVQITSLGTFGTGFSLPAPPALPVTLGPSGKLLVDVHYNPPGGALTLSTGTLGLSCGLSTASIDLRGAPFLPVFAPTPRDLDLGELPLGAAKSQILTLRNTGTCPGETLTAHVSGALTDSLTVDVPPDLLIGPGESKTVRVTYKCTRSGDLDAHLSFRDKAGLSRSHARLTASCD